MSCAHTTVPMFFLTMVEASFSYYYYYYYFFF